MPPRVLIPIADGSEDIESVTLIDVLRRAGAAVTIASVEAQTRIRAARGTLITADALIEDCQDGDWDLIALPGGMPGADHLHDSAPLRGLLRAQHERERPLAAVCAAPARVLGRHGLLQGRRATCYPGFEGDLLGARIENAAVVRDGHITTSRGPATAMAFALSLVGQLHGAELAQEIGRQMLYEAALT